MNMDLIGFIKKKTVYLKTAVFEYPTLNHRLR